MTHFKTKTALFYLILSTLLTVISCKKTDKIFSLHLLKEPSHLDPGRSRSSYGGYLFTNLLKGLYRYSPEGLITADGGKCTWKNPTQLICTIIDKHYWQNGDPVTSSDYQRAFLHILNPQIASKRAQLIFKIKNAKKIHTGQSTKSKLGFKIITKKKFKLEFSKSDPDFIAKLTNAATFPRHIKQISEIENYKKFISNGPYKLKSWDFSRKLILTKNKNFYRGNPNRPDVEMYFVEQDKTAYRMYLSKKLDFLRRLTSDLIAKHQSGTDFYQINMSRFDYIGFGPRIQKNAKLKYALTHSLDFSSFKKVFVALGAPGCPSIPETWMQDFPCYTFNKNKIPKLSSDLLKKITNFNIVVSKLGGDDIKKAAEWLQSQWKTNLGIKFNILPTEQGVFLNQLRTQAPDVFRKGVGLDAPTCYEAISIFASNSPSNFIGFKNKNYDLILKKWENLTKDKNKKSLCTQAIKILLDTNSIVPLGRMYFSILANDKYTGWTLNSLNQLDLSSLKAN